MMDIKSLETLFANPGNEYRAKPFWSWNGELREDEVRRQIGIMQEMGLGGYFMHSRAGLITEYLGKDWFDLINAGADEGEARGMEAWLYDEDRWPSGSAGGKVTTDPQYRMKSLVIREEAPETFAWSDDKILCFLARIDGINLYEYFPVSAGTDITVLAEAQSTEHPGAWRAVSFSIVPDAPNSNYNGTTYIDTMSEKATRRFIELTHEQYQAHCGDRMGSSIKGIFTDEPHRGHAMDNYQNENGVITCSMAWTDDLFEEFRKRYGYSAEEVLPELFYRPDGERFAKVKHDYFDLADNLFLERFAKPINDWCEEHGIIFTGHVLHEDALTNQAVPQGSLMRFYQFMGYPGVDVLSEGNRCYWVVKQIASSARQIGKKWLLSELYGCTGWQMSFKGHKAVGDWQALFGINLRCPHLSWYTMEGESKRDYPASILHQSTWYPYYHAVESHFARFGALMSEGSPVCDVLVLNPVESVWSQSYLGWAQWIIPVSPEVQRLEDLYQQMFHILTDHQIDFDYGEEQMMVQMGKAELDEDGLPVLRVGLASYHTVVISGMETIRPTTLALLDEFIALGGHVIAAGDLPAYVDGVPSELPGKLADKAVQVPFETDAVVGAVRAYSRNYISVERDDGSTETDVFVQVRKYDDGFGMVLLNTDREHGKDALTVKIACGAPMHCSIWDMESGKRYNADSLVSYDGKLLSARFSLAAAGTIAFVMTAEENGYEAIPTVSEKAATVHTVKGEFPYRLNEKNVCVLDFARWKWEGGEWSSEAEILKCDQQVRDSIGIERRGGEMLQPWYAKLHDTKNYGHLTVEYTFDIETMPTTPVFLAGERPERISYAINGVKLTSPDVHDFWIDDCFKRMPVPADTLKTGRNVITADVEFMRTTNLEALYLIGDFGVKTEGHKRALATLPAVIGCENLDRCALPFYTGELTYILTADRYADLVKGAEKVTLSPTAFTGSLVKVSWEGADEKLLCWDPYTADVTEAVKAGKDILVTVVGTRRNLFGPLHLVPAIHGAYGPGHFVTEGGSWSDDYVLIDSGLTGIDLTVTE